MNFCRIGTKRISGLQFCLANLFVLAFLVNCSRETTDTRDTQRFNQLVDQYFSDFSRMRPIEATITGYHSYDDQLGRYDAGAMAEQTAYMKSMLRQLDSFDVNRLDASSKRDRLILQNAIRAELIDLEEFPLWKKNPSYYSDILNDSILRLIERVTAPKSERLRLVIERERQIPAFLDVARTNIDHPSRLMVETAIDQFKGTITFFKDVVPQAFADSSATELVDRLKTENAKVIKACQGFVDFLEKDVLPSSNPEFALGEDLLQKKLKYREMIDLPMATLEQRGLDRLKQVQGDFLDTAKKIDATKSPQQVLESVARDHPTGEQLIPAIRRLLEEMRAFCISKNLVTIPSEVRCEVTETAPFARTLSLASLDVPGPYEPFPQEAYFKVTLPDPSWPPDRREGHLRFFNYAALPTVTAFETYPGRYLQYLWSKPVPSKVRRMLPSDFFRSGWAHYAEQLVLDEGYRSGDAKVQLAQLRNSLLRLGRFLTAIDLHTGKMTPEQAVDFFVREAYQERTSAERETRRSITAPMRAMSYAWGKLEILQLREEYRQKKGEAFSLKDFHNDLLRHGAPPIPVLRQILFEAPEGRVQ